MSRRIKALGLAAVAVLALTAVSAASASAHVFKTASSPTFLKGEQATKNVFTVEGGTMKCTGVVFTSAEITGTVLSSVTLHPEYTGCAAFGQNAVVNTGPSITNGCNYVLNAEGTVNVVCVGGTSAITITLQTAGCVITIAPQSNLSKVKYENVTEGGFGNVLVTAEVEGISYTSSGGICGGNATPGKYTGPVLTKGFSSAFSGQHSISWE